MDYKVGDFCYRKQGESYRIFQIISINSDGSHNQVLASGERYYKSVTEVHKRVVELNGWGKRKKYIPDIYSPYERDLMRKNNAKKHKKHSKYSIKTKP